MPTSVQPFHTPARAIHAARDHRLCADRIECVSLTPARAEPPHSARIASAPSKTPLRPRGPAPALRVGDIGQRPNPSALALDPSGVAQAPCRPRPRSIQRPAPARPVLSRAVTPCVPPLRNQEPGPRPKLSSRSPAGQTLPLRSSQCGMISRRSHTPTSLSVSLSAPW